MAGYWNDDPFDQNISGRLIVAILHEQLAVDIIVRIS